MQSLAVLLIAAAGAGEPERPAPTTPIPEQREKQQERLLVLDFDGDAPQSLKDGVEAKLASALAAIGGYQVFSTDEVRRIVDLEAERQSVSSAECSTDCAASAAAAAGARFVVIGAAAGSRNHADGKVHFDLSLYDAAAQRIVGRATVKARSVDDLDAPAAASALLVGRPRATAGVGGAIAAGGVLAALGGGAGVIVGVLSYREVTASAAHLDAAAAAYRGSMRQATAVADARKLYDRARAGFDDGVPLFLGAAILGGLGAVAAIGGGAAWAWGE